MPCNFFNKSPIWIYLNQDICINGISYKKEKNINSKSATYNQLRMVKPSGKPCQLECGINWKFTGIEECVNCYSRKQQSDGCGNIRWILVNEGKCNNTPNWVETSTFTCFQSQSHIIERDINPCSPTFNTTQIGKISGNACATTCLPNWIDYSPYTQRCFENVSQIYQQDGCGNFRWITGGDACEETCIPNWQDTGNTRCNGGINEKEQYDGCTNTRWVLGGNACNTNLTESSFLAYVSYNTYVGNTATNNLFRNTQDLYNAMYTSMFIGESIISSFYFTNSVLSLGDSIYINGSVVTGTAYLGYFEGNNMKYVKILNGVVSEIGSTLTGSTISPTIVLFPYYTRTNSGDTGYGYLASTGAYWKARLRITSDNQTLDFYFPPSTSGTQFNFNDGTYNYIVKPYFRIGRNAKIYGIPNNYKIPDIYKGTWIELLCSMEVYSDKSPSETEENYIIRKGNVESNFNSVYHLLIGK